MDISIVIPTLNEGKNLSTVLSDVKRYFRGKGTSYEIIVVDGYSKDRTVDIAERLGAKVIFDDVGKGSALRKGIGIAKGKIVITMDADCSHMSRELGLLIEGINAGFDICMGSRFIKGGGTEDMPWYRKMGNKFFVFLVNLFWRTNYSDLCYGYRSFRKNSIERLGLKSNGFGIETELAIKAAKKRLKVLEVPSFEKNRMHGEGKLNTFKDGWLILKLIVNELV